MLLREALPVVFFQNKRNLEYWTHRDQRFFPTDAARNLDVEVLAEFKEGWPFGQENVKLWWQLANGKIVGWLTDDCFPVFTYNAVLTKEKNTMAKVAVGTTVNYTWTDGTEHSGAVRKWGSKWAEIKNSKTNKIDYIPLDKVQVPEGQAEEAKEEANA
jgi:hypothetical protein